MPKKTYSISELQQYNTIETCLNSPPDIPKEIQVAPEAHISRIFSERKISCAPFFSNHCLPKKPDDSDAPTAVLVC
ncbi:hypothetical protein Lbir_1989 [Legionella birminghamensis]|uniref:Uncharacterized protein n=1 Tax=Legionella birminghamensis TaxID=28083 RepID=A0A378ICM8_9GAMM|nr:hypothetical protein [Legionella birminghamensis]KTC69510.1 hypothetical protein Lbir_1989 [Legionella birminghamensis]STX32321.1 Uncharacterised protein [Legionella birminghamensis]